MTDRIGEYELIHHVATGGMAEVWVAKHISDPEGRSYAIKRILPHLAREEKFVEMFLDEARIASQLDHPNIVRIDELGEWEGEYYIAMEYIDGADLAEVLDLAERLGFDIPIGVAVLIAIEVLDALGYAHDFREGDKPLDIVHRDVSPHNVLVSHKGDVRLVDFGVAKAVERHSKTETGFVKGKLSYMSPEQIRQDDLDRRSDVFAVGVVLYELLTKETPFGRELTAVNAILNEEAPDPSKLRKSIPKDLVKVIHKALEKDANDRYPSARQMAAELKNIRDIKYSGVDGTSIAMMLAKLYELTMGETLEYDAMRTSMAEEEASSDPTVKTPTDEIAAVVSGTENNDPPKKRGWLYAIVLLLVAGVGGGAFAFWTQLSTKKGPDDGTTEVAQNSTETNAQNEDSANKKTELAAVVKKKKEEKTLPNPFEEEGPDNDGFYFVLEDADQEIQEGDEVVLELDEDEIKQILSFTFDRTETDQHADFLVDRIMTSFSAVGDPRIDPGDPEFDSTVLDFDGPRTTSKTKPKTKPSKKRKVVAKKKTRKKKTKKRVVKRKKRRKTKKKLASKKKPLKKIRKRNKTDVIDKSIPGGF